MQARNVCNFVVAAIILVTVIRAVHEMVHVKQWTSTKVRSSAAELILETPQRAQSRKQTQMSMMTST